MKTIYSLKELELMREETCEAIQEALKEATKDGFKTAAELAKECNLCTKMHIASGVSGLYDSAVYTPGGDCHRVQRRTTYRRKTHHFIEVDNRGKEIRRFDKDAVTRVYEYKF